LVNTAEWTTRALPLCKCTRSTKTPDVVGASVKVTLPSSLLTVRERGSSNESGTEGWCFMFDVAPLALGTSEVVDRCSRRFVRPGKEALGTAGGTLHHGNVKVSTAFGTAHCLQTVELDHLEVVDLGVPAMRAFNRQRRVQHAADVHGASLIVDDRFVWRPVHSVCTASAQICEQSQLMRNSLTMSSG
jgi:hypothetical protein